MGKFLLFAIFIALGSSVFGRSIKSPRILTAATDLHQSATYNEGSYNDEELSLDPHHVLDVADQRIYYDAIPHESIVLRNEDTREANGLPRHLLESIRPFHPFFGKVDCLGNTFTVHNNELKMAGYLLCLTAAGGVPVFTRKVGNVSTLPYPLIGSLNGVHMFAASHNVKLLSTSSQKANIVWKEFHNSVVMIAILGNDGTSDSHILRFLDLVFGSIVLLIGYDAIVQFRSVERVKKDIRCCFRLLDSLLSQLVSPHSSKYPFKLTSHATECFIANDVNTLQGCLDLFVESALSTYGCLLIDGQIVVATKKWWSLMDYESALLAAFVESCPPATCRDIPIYLPCSSPTVPHRLLTFQLFAKAEVCILCGTTPTLTSLKNNAIRFWKSSYEALRTAMHSMSGELPSSWGMDKNILGLYIINLIDHKSLCLFHPPEREDGRAGNLPLRKDRVNILHKFYTSVAGTLFPDGSNNLETSCILKKATETYIYAECFKCYAVRDEQYQLYVLYSNSIPNFAIRSTTGDLFNVLVKKLFR